MSSKDIKPDLTFKYDARGKEPAYPTMFFALYLDDTLAGSFMSISGLSFQYEMDTYAEGGRNSGELIFPRLPATGRLTLEYGVCGDDVFVDIMHDYLSGIFTKFSGKVVMMNQNAESLHEWEFSQAYVSSIIGPDFNALNSELAITRVELTHNGVLQTK